jgi:hypothetical protein
MEPEDLPLCSKQPTIGLLILDGLLQFIVHLCIIHFNIILLYVPGPLKRSHICKFFMQFCIQFLFFLCAQHVLSISDSSLNIFIYV